MKRIKPSRELRNYILLAADGAIGRAEAFCFDDAWAIRYLVVDADSRLSGGCGGRLLVSPAFVGGVNMESKEISIELTRGQIEKSPLVSAITAVPRIHEPDFGDYHGSPYRESSFLSSAYPMPPTPLWPEETRQSQIREMRLCSTDEVDEYAVETRDGAIGHIEDVFVDIRDWVIRYLEITTLDGMPGERVLVKPDWIRHMSWIESTAEVSCSRQMQRNSFLSIHGRS